MAPTDLGRAAARPCWQEVSRLHPAVGCTGAAPQLPWVPHNMCEAGGAFSTATAFGEANAKV